jgi:uncharacterized protein YqgV (UPF0045/DUF77 family)
MKKQTAVEWLIDYLKDLGLNYQLHALNDIIEQGKAMEREQIINAYDAGTFYLRGEDYFIKTFEDESGI